MKEFELKFNDKVIISEPLGFFDFVHLELNSKCILTDSGTVLEEACILKIPNLIIRDVTERPEVLGVGSSYITRADSKNILKLVKIVLSRKPDWSPPSEYMAKNVSDTVVRILLDRRKSNDNWS